MTTYPLAKHAIFETIQGEGVMLGVPMTFIRLAGCTIGCPECDTDYSLGTRLNAVEIRQVVEAMRGEHTQWTWVTGGEPAVYELGELISELKRIGKVAVATSGMRKNNTLHDADFLSVSPHCKPDEIVIASGSQINIVPGMNGLFLNDWADYDNSRFWHAYVTPCDGKPETLKQCIEFVKSTKGWRLGVQAHKVWNIA